MLRGKKYPQASAVQHMTFTLLTATLLALVLTQPLPANAGKFSDWSAPVNLGSVVNSAFSDQQPAISKNGLSLYFTSNRPFGLGGFDLQVAQRTSIDEPWGSPINLGPIVNSVSNEGNPAFSRDGHLMFFQSDRAGGLGGLDIWVSRREHTHDDFAWQAPVNLGSPVNSAAGENAPSYLENDETGMPQLYFAGNRAGGLGGLDIYVSEQAADGSYGPPTLLTQLSSAGGDSRPSIGHNGLEIFIQSDRGGTTGGADLWVATRESALSPWSIPVNLGSTVNTISLDQNPFLSSDGMTLLFASDRLGGSGGQDLYMTTRTKVGGKE